MFYLLLVWRKFIILNLEFVGDDVDERIQGDRMNKENKKTRIQGNKKTRKQEYKETRKQENKKTRKQENKETRR